MTQQAKCRLITRADFDGLVCAVLLKELGKVEEIVFVHPHEMQDGEVEITGRDITTNLPYVPGCNLAFDHHSSELLRLEGTVPVNYINDPEAPSVARVIFEHYGGRKAFPAVPEEMLAALDKGDAAQFTTEEILNPEGWGLLNFLMDARTGLGRFRDFRISNHELMMRLIDDCRMHDVDEILALPDVMERVKMFREHREEATEQIQRCSTVHGNLVVLDLKNEPTIFVTNRFLIYALFPKCNISIHVMWGQRKQNTVFAIGNSITNRTSHTDIGELCLRNGGGGHRNAGTCQIDHELADELLSELIQSIRADHEGVHESHDSELTSLCSPRES